jgi:lipopolysaccharide transport system ATP-binding protein
MKHNLSLVANNVSKKFGLTLKQSLKYGLRDMAQTFIGSQVRSDRLRQGEFWAVRNVGFEIGKGESLGIMGVNGSGKSTLLRLLNGVYAPDDGLIQIRGRVAALIAAGAGFAPMLSGRENVYINGSLLGLTKREVDKLMDEIIAFSELEEFIDLPVRNYSSGMFVRLGFAIAALSRPDVLLMDEVLAVGDLNFQKKCFDCILGLKQQGTSIVLVSHSPGSIWAVCDRGLFMDHGHVLVQGSAEDVVRAYDDQNARNAASSSLELTTAHAVTSNRSSKQSKKATAPLRSSGELHSIDDVLCRQFRILSREKSAQVGEIDFQEVVDLELEIEVFEEIRDVAVRVVIDAAHYKNILVLDSYEQGLSLPALLPGRHLFKIALEANNLRPGAYTFNATVISKHIAAHLSLWLKCATLVIKTPKPMFFYAEPLAVLHLPAVFSCSQLPSVEGRLHA